MDENLFAVFHDPFGVALMGKDKFSNQTKTDLDITTPSLAFEMWMHADFYSKGLGMPHSNPADCGERDADRWFWDTRTAGIPDDRQSFYDAMKDAIR